MVGTKRHSRRNGTPVVEPAALIKLDLGGGQRKEEGWTTIDSSVTAAPDIVHDLLTFPWPLADESVEEARAIHFLEHIPHLCYCCRDQQEPFFAFMDELARVLVPGGKMWSISPYWSSPRAWQDPTHTRAINEWVFLYLNRQWRDGQGMGHYDVHCDFDFSYSHNVQQEWASKHEDQRNFAVQHLVGVVDDVSVTIIKHELSCARNPYAQPIVVCDCRARERLGA